MEFMNFKLHLLARGPFENLQVPSVSTNGRDQVYTGPTQMTQCFTLLGTTTGSTEV